MTTETTASKIQKHDDSVARGVRRVATEAPTGIFHNRIPSKVMEELYAYADKMNADLIAPHIGHKAPRIILSLDVNDARQLGHYKIGRDGLGLAWRISLNLVNFGRGKADILSTLLHEMLHATQHESGTPGKGNYHNAEFIEWCAKLGIPTDSGGHDKGITEGGVFAAWLKTQGIEGHFTRNPDPDKPGAPLGPAPLPLPKPKGSRLKKWSCTGCERPVNVRVAIPDFDATCNKCGTRFERQN